MRSVDYLLLKELAAMRIAQTVLTRRCDVGNFLRRSAQLSADDLVAKLNIYDMETKYIVQTFANDAWSEIEYFIESLKKISDTGELLSIPLSKLRWTTLGLVDAKETAKLLIQDDTLSLAYRYKLACFFSLKKYILELWDEFPLADRHTFSQSCDDMGSPDMIALWSLVASGKMDIYKEGLARKSHDLATMFLLNRSIETEAFECVKYFWEQVPDGEKKDVLLKTYHRYLNCRPDRYRIQSGSDDRGFSDELRVFLFSKSDSRDSMVLWRLDEDYGQNMLWSYLKWPFVLCFMDAFDKLQTVAPEFFHATVVSTIQKKMLISYGRRIREYCFSLLQEILKRVELCAMLLSDILTEFLEGGDEESCLVILNYFPTELKEEMVFEIGCGMCMEFKHHDNLEAIGFLLKEVVPPNKIQKFQNLFKPPNPKPRGLHFPGCPEVYEYIGEFIAEKRRAKKKKKNSSRRH